MAEQNTLGKEIQSTGNAILNVLIGDYPGKQTNPEPEPEETDKTEE